MRRREFIRITVASLAAATLRAGAQEVQDIRPLVEAITHGAAPEEGGIDIVIPPIAENGHSVPLTVKIASPMTEADHVAAIHLIAERNPRPLVASFHLKPESGRAEISTRVRLAGTQKVTVLAGMSDGRFRMTQTEVLVTSAACLDESM